MQIGLWRRGFDHRLGGPALGWGRVARGYAADFLNPSHLGGSTANPNCLGVRLETSVRHERCSNFAPRDVVVLPSALAVILTYG